jgi:phenylalanyl-tRNA synthetase beta chain
LGAVGELDPDVVRAYGLSGRIGYLSISVDDLLAQPRRPLEAREISRYPASDVDLAFLVDEAVPAAAVGATLREAGGETLEDVWLFDVYRGGQVGVGRRSLAFRLRFRALDRTLADSELAASRQSAIDAVGRAHGGELRT